MSRMAKARVARAFAAGADAEDPWCLKNRIHEEGYLAVVEPLGDLAELGHRLQRSRGRRELGVCQAQLLRARARPRPAPMSSPPEIRLRSRPVPGQEPARSSGGQRPAAIEQHGQQDEGGGQDGDLGADMMARHHELGKKAP